ncbi:MAG TPA: replication-relaxation family protein, partial [Solirubrobacteraceae bacterium]|nr:replication-relaxation family protein [Solirubrobacteraceae bacterium]
MLSLSVSTVLAAALGLGSVALLLLLGRALARRGRRYVRLGLVPYRTDRAHPEALAALFDSLNNRLLARWWQRAVCGQRSLALELHVRHATGSAASQVGPATGQGPAASAQTAPVPCQALLAVTCPAELVQLLAATLRSAYPNLRLVPWSGQPAGGLALVRLKKRERFTRRLEVMTDEEQALPVDRLLRVMAAAATHSVVQLTLTPVPAWFERWASRPPRRRPQETDAAQSSDSPRPPEVHGADRRAGALFFADLRVLAPTRRLCGQIASELRSHGAANQLVPREAVVRHRVARVYRRRIERGEGNPIPSCIRGVYASPELAGLWQLPSVGFTGVPLERSSVPLVAAPPAILRPPAGPGLLADEFGPVTLHEAVRWQNVAVPGAVGHGKTSLLVASVREDLARPRCAVIVFDPKGDAADAAVSVVPEGRACTLLDLARPTCGCNPLAVNAPPDSIADAVVAALRNLFSDSDIRASSDRYLRNAIVAALAYDPNANLWDAARLLSVTEEGRAFRQRVGTRMRELPEYKEIADFFGDELPAQLEDARATTTAKLDAPANKLARVLNVPAIKRVLLNRSLTIDFERIIAAGEVLVVRGALGEMGAGNTAVLMQLLIGMLDAALARQQDLRPAAERMTVALKIDEAPLVINRGFAATLALKRSAGLETVACWQTDSQWEEPAVRDQLEALFAHRVYFATPSAQEARATASLMMAEYSDQVRAGTAAVTTLGHPDVRLYLPRHVALVSWNAPGGRQAPFIGRTAPLVVDPDRLTHHAAAQAARGARAQEDLSQPHWEGDAWIPEGVVGRSESADSEDSFPQPAAPPDSYAELIALDAARSVRQEVPPTRRGSPGLQRPDRPMLEWIAELGCALSAQVHRRWNPDRAPSTTQRQLKRLWEGGWLARLQFHQPDGGGVPMCYLPTGQTLRMLASHREGSPARAAMNRDAAARDAPNRDDVSPSPHAVETIAGFEGAVGPAGVRAARRATHVTGWVAQAERHLGPAVTGVRGWSRSVLRPPPRGPRDSRPEGPGDLSLPGGRRPHGFLRSTSGAKRVEIAEFEAVRPDATIVLAL